MSFALRAESSFADLRLAGGFHGEHVYVCGYAAMDDGSQGLFRWDSASTATANNDTIIAVTGVTSGRWIRVLVERNLPNYVRNGGMWFAQRQAPGTLTTYSSSGGNRALSADGWGITNETASVQYIRVDTSAAPPEAGLQGQFYGTFSKITATGKVVVSQVIEAKDTAALRGRTVRVQLWLKAPVVSSVSPTINIALLQLTSGGTADVIPFPFISAHGANNEDPTVPATLAYILPKSGVPGDNTTPSITAPTGCYKGVALPTWQRFGGVFDVPSDAKNLVVLIYTNSQFTTSNTFSMSQVSLTDGIGVQDWSPQSYQQELARVRRFYTKTFAVDSAPIQNAGVSTGCLRCTLGKAAATALAAQFQWRFPESLRAAPAQTITYNPAAASAAVRQIGGTAGNLTATTVANVTEQSLDVTATGIATGAVGDQCGVHITADAEL